MLDRLPLEILRYISYFSDGINAARCIQVNNTLQAIYIEEELWKNLCSSNGIWQQGTRSRGRLLYRHMYIANACIECHQPGTVKLDMSSAYTVTADPLISLCSTCFHSVASVRTMTERRRNCLLRLAKQKTMANVRFRILVMIPESKKRKKHS